jgi:diguanylate cyclase (GGDEF)-like protein/PAS domain S-box-containing protein
MMDEPHQKRTLPKGGISRRLIAVVWVFMAAIVCLLALTYYSIGLMSAGRAYVGGEGLWSKAQKEAVFALSRYAQDHDPRDYQAYQSALAVSLGDRQARLEMEKAQSDPQMATAGFLRGRNHPDDVAGMIALFRNFSSLPEIEKARAVWRQGDGYMEQLAAVGEQIHDAVQAGTLDDAASRGYLARLQQLNTQLTPLEDEFSYVLGEASRKAAMLLRLALLAVATVLLTVAYVFSRRVVKQSEDFHQALLEGNVQLRTLLQFAPLPIIVVRLDSETIAYANQRACVQFKVPADAWIGMRPHSFYAREQDRAQVVEALQRQGSVRDWEVQLQDAEGTRFWALLSSQRTVYEGRDCLLTAINNIDERRQAQEALRHRAFHDDLTGLPNRAMFMDALSRTLSRMERKNGQFSILFIDLDHFKDVNDQFGHAVGDLLLHDVAMRIRLCVREGDLVARLGGDEFVILVEDGDEHGEVTRVAQKVQDELEPAHQLAGKRVQVTASIGISRYPMDGLEINDLLRNADGAMYQAKEAGRNTFQFSDSKPAFE